MLAIWLINGATQIGGGNLAIPGGTFTLIGAADFNGDGRTDLLFRDA